MHFTKYTPCKSCPYQLKATLAHWHIDHFKELIVNSMDYIGKTYGCHNNDGHVCRGFLQDQLKGNIPAIALRLSLIKNNVSREYLDKVEQKCSKIPAYTDIVEMAKANFPEFDWDGFVLKTASSQTKSEIFTSCNTKRN